jgi:hypothetical protein
VVFQCVRGLMHVCACVDIKNPQEMLEGEKAIYEEIGPFVYWVREHARACMCMPARSPAACGRMG